MLLGILDDPLSGHGWVLVQQDLLCHLGLKSTHRSLLPVHAVFDSLLWAMECMISISNTSGTFATRSDCLAKNARDRKNRFFHVSTSVFEWFSVAESISPIT